ncbi:tryptophan-rich sensory protein [Methanohalophilus profundi]|uniref:tryptophan-rich sensory protein n=1 Tax=Methanohalophilus profundi TaxID=2138083 RepID=UPI001CDD56A1|nr:tryptophan-rich sensory protein [Methanohalophilus profundi]
MERNQPTLMIKIITTVTFSAMVIANALANALPINGLTTGQISDFYPNPFAPTGWTFAIWGLIYLLLAGYTLYQLGVFQDNENSVRNGLLSKIGILFSISSIANAAWIFAWHYQIIPLSLLLMS